MIYDLVFAAEPAEVRRYLGYRPGRTEETPSTERLLQQMIAAVDQAARPRGLIRTFDLNRRADATLEIRGAQLPLTASDLLRLLQQSTRVSLLAATLGPGVDQLIGDLLAQGRYAAAATADAVASAAAEQAVEQLQAGLQAQANAQQFTLTRRFSPGYGDVPLELQAALARLLPLAAVGVTVSDAHLLLPRKSITALAGWQPGQEGRSPPREGCAECALTGCQFRRNQPESR